MGTCPGRSIAPVSGVETGLANRFCLSVYGGPGLQTTLLYHWLPAPVVTGFRVAVYAGLPVAARPLPTRPIWRYRTDSVSGRLLRYGIDAVRAGHVALAGADGFAEFQLADVLGECTDAAGVGAVVSGAAGVEGEWDGEDCLNQDWQD